MSSLIALLEEELFFGAGGTGQNSDSLRSTLIKRIAALPPGESPLMGDGPLRIYLRSLCRHGEILFGMLRHDEGETREGARTLFPAADVRPSTDLPGDLRLAEQFPSAPWVATAELSVENARELRHRGVTVNSLAPRFIGEFQGAIDYAGDLAEFDAIEPLEEVGDEQLHSYLEDENARQMLHISYGGILHDRALNEAIYAALHHHEEEYAEMLRSHFEKHIALPGVQHID